MPSQLQAVVAATKSDHVINELERRILSGEFAPGERLPTEPDLSEQLGVSRSVIRDAMRTLAARGLVNVQQGRGTTVAVPDAKTFGHAFIVLLSRSNLTMRDVVDARAALETSLARLAAERGDERDWASMQDQLQTLEAAVEASDWKSARDAHLAFHLGIIHAVHLPVLELIVRPMTEIIVVSSMPPEANKAEDWGVERHAPILDALRSRDAAATEDVMNAHFAATATWPRYQAFYEATFSTISSELTQTNH